MGSVFEEAARLAPVNKSSASAVSGGTNYEPEVNIASPHSDTPLPMKPVTPRLLSTATFTDLRGERQGRFTVMGLCASSKKTRWVVRCDCGNYEIRKSIAIRNPDNKIDMCLKCRATIHARKSYDFAKTGKSTNMEDYI